ncbi:hypothetical protein [Blastopirellula retiformator]|uniref:Uncharacterized protein n=1 Tax=Blastopirellula retiformator TaxID=2527970 RepID=A0A5C5VLE6_9BACT|nr:hypothetical protein [Blastopirellula retiformator]TWT38883.1 hypothetical protein Enr8_05770 [Blastopirellula retiformator]
MRIQILDDALERSLAAGYADVEQFVNGLIRNERERLALQAGIDAMDAGQVTAFSEFDRQFRAKNGIESP